MGIRRDQFMGLNEWASNFVNIEPIVCEESGEYYYGMFENKYPLHKYTLPDGRVYFERLQTVLWSSGPVHFLALQDEEGNWVPKSLWADEDIEAA